VTPDLAHRRSLLTAALGFALLDTRGKPEDYGAVVVCGQCRGAPEGAKA
jgi:hypothetical protein